MFWKEIINHEMVFGWKKSEDADWLVYMRVHFEVACTFSSGRKKKKKKKEKRRRHLIKEIYNYWSLIFWNFATTKDIKKYII